MKILLVVKSKAMEVLGCMYLSSVIKKAGSQCKIVDINEAFEVTKAWGPNAIGFSIMTGDKEKFRLLADKICRFYELIEDVSPTIIVGGSDVTFFPTGYEWADHIVRGEAEQWFADFLGHEVDYSDINSIPHPDRTDFPGMKIRDFIGSRSCPYSCAHCYNSKWKEMFPEHGKMRYRDVSDVVSEVKSTNPEYVYWQDSCFGVDMRWMREFSKQYRREVGVPYQCHLRPEQVNEERILLLADSGCMSIRIALESASKRIRKLINRGTMTDDHVTSAVRLMKKWGIKVMLQNMIGIPSGTIEDDLATLEFNIRCNPTYSWVSIYQPYPGTVLGDYCVKNGYYTGDYSDLASNFFDTSFLNFSEGYKEQLECLQKVFALCVEVGYVPKEGELRHDNFKNLTHKIMRTLGDRRLYGNAI